jgi:hypothetical protein
MVRMDESFEVLVARQQFPMVVFRLGPPPEKLGGDRQD